MDRPVKCARHPGRPAVTTCARCERPVCTDDLIEAPVGYQCVDCARSAPPVRRLGERPATPVTRALVVTIALVAIAGPAVGLDVRSAGLVPALVGTGEWWRLLTSALLHGGLIHLAFNGLLLWQLGQLLEPGLGTGPFLGLVAGGTAGGSLGVVGIAWLFSATPLATLPLLGRFLGAGPLTVTVGASGAVFGLMGAVLVLLRRRGIDPWASREGSMVGSLVVLNLVLTFVVPAISVGGHVGGLLGGAAAATAVRLRADGAAANTARTLLLAAVLLGLAVAAARDLVRAFGG